jgi:hypothetical protein
LVVVFAAIIWRKDYRGGRNAVTHTCRSNTVKPVLRISRDGGPAAPAQALLRFIQEHNIKALNVAGPRASKEPEVGAFVKEALETLLE